MDRVALWRRLLAELLGSAFLAAAVIGSGIAAEQLSPGNVGLEPPSAHIGAAYFFTSSTSFANPAISVGRMFSDTFAGIAPGSVPGYVIAEVAGGVLGFLIIKALYPRI